MERRSIGHVWKAVLVAIALIATLMALYVQLFERQSREAEDRLVAARMTDALEGARTRLKAELLAELRKELAESESPSKPGGPPLPNAVLRRSETARDRALQQGLASEDSALNRLEGRLDSLARQMDESDRTVRRNLEEIRAEMQREEAVTAKVTSLLLAALIALVLVQVISLLEERKAGRAG
jgi:Flp pilus assembly pilin Flp